MQRALGRGREHPVLRGRLPHLEQEPGRLTFAEVTLERGATQDRDLFGWLQDVAVSSSGLCLANTTYGTTLRRWSLSHAWRVEFVAGDWDNDSNENILKSVTLHLRLLSADLVHMIVIMRVWNKEPATMTEHSQTDLLTCCGGDPRRLL